MLKSFAHMGKERQIYAYTHTCMHAQHTLFVNNLRKLGTCQQLAVCALGLINKLEKNAKAWHKLATRPEKTFNIFQGMLRLECS